MFVASLILVFVVKAVPGIAEAFVADLHSTNITWTFRIPYYTTAASQEKFLITVRDDTNGVVIVGKSEYNSVTLNNLSISKWLPWSSPTALIRQEASDSR